MTTTEHLTLIETHLKKLLAIAEKRQPISWYESNFSTCLVEDGRFFAACAGNAEAGWKSTLAAIEGLQKLSLRASGDIPDDVAQTIDGYADDADELLAEIIAAWPIELLK